MKKIISLIKACMTSEMSLFKINLKHKSRISKIMIILFLCFAFMSMTASYSSMMLEKLAPFDMQYVVLSLFVFVISIFTFIEGIYKSGSLLFNCKDDQLLLSLPIKKSTVLFIRIFKFYVFELMFNSLFFVPLMVCYMIYTKVTASFIITSIVMLLLLPIIPIVLSCIIGTIITWLSGKFRFKNFAQIFITAIFLLGVFYLSFNIDSFIANIAQKAASVNELITKIYYPAGAYAKLAVDFHISDLLLFIVINLLIFIICIFGLSAFYFKINSNIKRVTTGSHKAIKKQNIKKHSQTRALVFKEFNTFFKIPVFIINAGWGIILFLIAAFAMCFKYDSFLKILTTSGVELGSIYQNVPLLVVLIVAVASFTTSITSSMISLEGRNYAIVKSLPVSSKRVLLSKVLAACLLTIPALLIGVFALAIKFKIDFITVLLIIGLTILMPLVSHFSGLIINLKFPKLQFDSPTEVVKQSISTFAALLFDFIVLIAMGYLLFKFADKSLNVMLLILTFIMGLIDFVLYLYLVKRGTRLFEDLTL